MYKKGTNIIEAIVGNYITIYIIYGKIEILTTNEFLEFIKKEGYEQLN